MLSLRCATATLFPLVLLTSASAQFAGSRGGAQQSGERASFEENSLPLLKPEVAEAYITIDGTAEVRVRPTQIRIVLAVTSEAESAQLCDEAVSEKIKTLRAAWKQLQLEEDDVVEDFIAVLPRYQWQEGKRNERDVLIETTAGYRMQTNLHVVVPNERSAQAALRRAFEQGVTDIIAFDYVHKELDRVKEETRATALKSARSKADVLLGAVVEGELKVINLQEQTRVHYPESLYRSFTNVVNQEVSQGWRDNLPRIHAHRPQNTYYRGLTSDSDVQPNELPMRAEITITSTVRLYFASPEANKKPARKKKATRAERSATNN